MSEPSHDQFLPHFLPVQADLRAFIGAAVRDVVTREDVFQEVAMILWKKFELYDPARPFGAWARGIAIRKIMEDRRLREKLPQSCTAETLEALAHGFDADEAEAPWKDREKALHRCLEQLPERSARLIRERYHQNHSIERMASEESLSADAIYQILSRLRRQLRDCVERRLGLTLES
ncbi:MAG: sigma-70 family RNA polymerase sigma factor [Verrucomicrobiota bacterium]